MVKYTDEIKNLLKTHINYVGKLKVQKTSKPFSINL